MVPLAAWATNLMIPEFLKKEKLILTGKVLCNTLKSRMVKVKVKKSPVLAGMVCGVLGRKISIKGGCMLDRNLFDTRWYAAE